MKFNVKISKYICLILSLFIILSVCGCTDNKVIDKSERVFSTIHFNGRNQNDRTLSATNGEDIFYVNGNGIYKYGCAQAVMKIEKEIRTLTVSSNNLYIVYDDDSSYDVCDINSFEVTSKSMQNLESLAANGNLIFGEINEPNGLFYYDENSPDNVVSLSDIICSGQPLGEVDGYYDIYLANVSGTDIYSDAIDKIDGKWNAVWLTVSIDNQPRFLEDFDGSRVPLYLYKGNTYFVNKGYGRVYNKWGEDKEIFDSKTGKYRDSINNKFIQDGVVYELIQRPDYHGNQWAHSPYIYNFPQYYTVCDCIIANDLENSCSSTLYKTENNLTRIIGFDGELIYLFDTEKYTISSYNLNSNVTTQLQKVQELDELSFEWCGKVLFIYDNQNNIVDILSI